MKRLQIMIEEDLDDALAREAAQKGVSKAALIRRYVRDRLKPLPPLAQDPLWGMVGSYDGEPAVEVDDVIYGS